MTTIEAKSLVGWRAIAVFTPYSWETLRKLYRKQLIAAGVVVMRKVGRPPKSRPTAYPHDLANFFSQR